MTVTPRSISQPTGDLRAQLIGLDHRIEHEVGRQPLGAGRGAGGRAHRGRVGPAGEHAVEHEEADAALVDVMGGVFARAGAGGDEFTMKLRNGALVRYRDHLKGVITRNESRPERRMQVAVAWLKVAEAELLLRRLDDAAASLLSRRCDVTGPAFWLRPVWSSPSTCNPLRRAAIASTWLTVTIPVPPMPARKML